MSRNSRLKPGHKAIQQYHAALKVYSGQHVEHEGALETAFQRLLGDTARDMKGWTLIPKQSMKVGGRTVIPDGTLRDDFLAAATGKRRTPTTTSTRKSARRSKKAIRSATSSSRTPGRPCCSRGAEAPPLRPDEPAESGGPTQRLLRLLRAGL